MNGPSPYDLPRRPRPGDGRPRSPFIPLFLGALMGMGIFYLFNRRAPAPVDATPRAVAARGDLAADEKATIALFSEASPSVVYITSLARRSSGWFDVMEVPQGTGTGFIWDRSGHVVTNFHVIKDADDAEVTLSDQSAWKARLVGAAPDKDLAVLRIEAKAEALRPLLLGTSRDLQVGQKVFAIGNPFGLDQTLTTGIVSALGRRIQSDTGRQIEGVIQTDAAINPGNSGGPLLDSAGRLIGVNTAIASPSGGNAGIGFAVPVDTVNLVVPQLIQHGRVFRPRLGVRLADARIAQRLGLKGILVLDVDAGSGAEKAGLRGTTRDREGALILGDVLVAVNGKKVAVPDDLMTVLETHKAGEKVEVTFVRDGITETRDVTLME